VWSEVRRHDADVVLMIEFGPNKKPLIPRMLQRYPFHKSCDYDWDCAIALFSRLPMHNIELVESGEDDGPRRISAKIALGKQVVTIIGSHILSPNHGPQANFAELDFLANLARERDGPMVVAGDLNTTIWAHSFDNFRRKSGLSHMGHLIPTWPVSPLPLPQIGIDHVFLSPELRLTEIAAGDAAGSDHLPLIATITLR
jgi:endonuclease/exonuclease/phosphatase (EEP) superfamily protein YafD